MRACPDRRRCNGAAPPQQGATAAGEVFGMVGEAPTAPATQVAPAHNATAAPASAEHAAEPPPQLDEDGNPIPPPPDPDALLKEAGNILASREYQKALDAYNAILALPNLNDEQREMAMYGVSDAQFGLGQDNLAEHFSERLSEQLLTRNPERILRSEPLPAGRFRPFF